MLCTPAQYALVTAPLWGGKTLVRLAFAGTRLVFAADSGTRPQSQELSLQDKHTCPMGEKEGCMKGLVAWFLGVPVIAIILLYVFGFF